MYHARRLLIVLAALGTLVFLLWLLPQVLNPVKPSRDKQEADRRWVDTSPSWLDRQACRWLGLCGLAHIRADPAEGRRRGAVDGDGGGAGGFWGEISENDSSSRNGNNTLKGIPQYVLDHAPLVHLYSGEHFWPSDIAEHLSHMVVPRSSLGGANLTEPLGLDNLAEQLNPYLNVGRGGGGVFLTSEVDVEDRPAWLGSKDNIPLPFPDNDEEGHGEGLVDGGDVNSRSGHPADSTTWFDVDKSHPLNRISDPRREPADRPGNHGDFLTSRKEHKNRESGEKRSRAFRPEYYSRPSDSSPEAASGAAVAQLQQYENAMNRPDNTSGYSRAPATLVLVDKGSGVLDAFWFFFYAYNLGQTVLGVRYGNHVGDWEHAMVRFESGVPRAVYFSEHEGGQAYAWSAVEKKTKKSIFHQGSRPAAGDGVDGSADPAASPAENDGPARPVIYSAVGSHAMYAGPGDHPYVLPFKMLRDVTDRGPLWDPARNMRSYWYDYTAADDDDNGDGDDSSDRGLTPTAENPDAPTSWFHYAGAWGDDYLSLADERQYRLFGQYHYVAGPQGPKAKNLGRSKVCQAAGDRPCRMIYSIEEGRRRSWHS
ncbi:hypothetical protein Micbo1qcDRAFT_204087 [Microdochium bolleyi]|uniref:Vacuolar protein sorting-associated protein n=1 Tax=Microdochium bolleyi TaxID=196109 RepID=A0A136J4N0_9PEZI|nr:hypothetical protein Micbo1qcDRAFT_204087 [Microdochium bolleyi]